VGSIIPSMKYWHPPHLRLPWIVALLALLSSVLPFLIAIYILAAGATSDQIWLLLRDEQLIASAYYTLKQAGLSAGSIIILAPIFALALAATSQKITRFSFLLRSLIFCLPSVVVASGLVLGWGKNGFATEILRDIGISSPVTFILYSPYAVVLANTLMNLPFASILLYKRLLEIPVSQIQSMRSLGLNKTRTFMIVFWPAIRPSLFYFGGLTFLMSMGSFGALSILGGGPQSRTLEIGIYQAIFYEGNWGQAAVFAVIHAIFCGIVSFLLASRQYRWLSDLSSSSLAAIDIESLRSQLRPKKSLLKFSFTALSLLLDIFIIIPILAIAFQAIHAIFVVNTFSAESLSILAESLLTSLWYATPAAFMAVGAAWSITRAFCRYKTFNQQLSSRLILVASLTAAVVPPMATAFGMLALRSTSVASYLGTPAIIICLYALTLPFLIPIILPTYSARLSPSEHTRILSGIGDKEFILRVEWPSLRSNILVGFGLSLSLGLNEASIVSMLGDPLHPAMTTSMIRMMGNYRFSDSSVASCLLILVTLMVVVKSSKIGSENYV